MRATADVYNSKKGFTGTPPIEGVGGEVQQGAY
jgi:hypothetical protein